ncbi:MAG: hypothetical protein RLP44_20670 [Aggregatilineales bacterium]
MDYPYPELTPLLKFHCSPEEYQSLIAKNAHDAMKHVLLPDDPDVLRYHEILPDYLYARCPICGAEAREQIDTYQPSPYLKYELDRDELYPPDFLEGAPCEHFLGVETVYNFHGQLLGFGGRLAERIMRLFVRPTVGIPHVSYTAIPDVIESYAVLHALPFCRIEHHSFVPAYTMFVVTYFNADPRRVIHHHHQQEQKQKLANPKHQIVGIPQGETELNSHKYGKTYDLAELISAGKLGFLDISRPDDLPLMIGKGTDLHRVYRDIST